MDQVLDALYFKDDPKEKYKYKKGFIEEQFNFRYKNRGKLLNDFKSLFMPTLIFK
jgi:hypothetical protein